MDKKRSSEIVSSDINMSVSGTSNIENKRYSEPVSPDTIIPRTLSPKGGGRRTMSPNTSAYLIQERKSEAAGSTQKNRMSNNLDISADKSVDS